MSPRPRPRPRRGATLIELLVALLILDLSLISLAAMSAVAARRIGDAGRRSRASIAVINRIENLRARPCAMAGGGTMQIEPNVLESWTVTAVPFGLEISDSVAMRVRAGDHVSARTRIPC